MPFGTPFETQGKQGKPFEAQGKPALRITPSGLPLSPKGGVHGDDLSIKDAGLKARRYVKT